MQDIQTRINELKEKKERLDYIHNVYANQDIDQNLDIN